MLYLEINISKVLLCVFPITGVFTVINTFYMFNTKKCPEGLSFNSKTKEQQGQSRIPVLWKLISHSSVFEIVSMSYFWKFLWLGRKSFDLFYFLKSKKNTSEWICFSFRSLENRIFFHDRVIFFLSTRTKLFKGDRSLFFGR